MSIESTHPKYDAAAPDWVLMSDGFAGSRTIKAGGVTYLPATSGMLVDGMGLNQPGLSAYNAYRCRAEYPELVTDAILTLTSVLNRHPAEIKVPTQLEPMLENITRKGETAQMLLRKIHENQLLFGRYGLMADFAQSDPFDGTEPLRVQGAPDLPHAVKWMAENIINWDDDRFTEFGREQLNFLVLSETIQTRGNAGADIFNFEQERRFRVLFLDESGIYTTYAERDEIRTPDVQPTYKGATLDEIPFVFIGSNDLNPAPDEIPLLGLGNLSLTIYRADADYRQALHAHAQETLVTIGDEGEESDEVEGTKADVRRIGVGASLDLPMGGDAKYIGPESRGIPEMRSGIENDRNRAEVMGSRFLENRGSQAESGDALRIRVSARTANLGTIAHTAAAGLESLLNAEPRLHRIEDRAPHDRRPDDRETLRRPDLDRADPREDARGRLHPPDLRRGNGADCRGADQRDRRHPIRVRDRSGRRLEQRPGRRHAGRQPERQHRRRRRRRRRCRRRMRRSETR